MVMLRRWTVKRRENHWYRGGQFTGGRMVITEVVSLIEGEWSCYRGRHFNGGRMLMLRWWSVY